MKSFVIKSIHKILGNHWTYRLGRSLYIYARKESSVNIKTDGEERIQRELIKLLSKEDSATVFDIGANVGDWTISLLEKLQFNEISNATIHAFEPIIDTYNSLKRNIEVHNMGGKVKLIPKGCSSSVGSDTMYLASTNSGSNSLHCGNVHSDLNTSLIEKITIEKYCDENKINMIHFIKSDTEGHEVEVIKGAKSLFDHEKILVFQFEYNLTWLYSRCFIKDIFDLFYRTPYYIGKISPEGLQIYREWHPEIERFFESNYVVIHRDVLNYFTHTIGVINSNYFYKIEKTYIAKNRVNTTN